MPTCLKFALAAARLYRVGRPDNSLWEKQKADSGLVFQSMYLFGTWELRRDERVKENITCDSSLIKYNNIFELIEITQK